MSALKLLTYNINWEADVSPGLEAVAASGAEIVCLQETNPTLQGPIESRLGRLYPFASFLHSDTRTGGGSAILARQVGRCTAHIVSTTGWFDARIFLMPTSLGVVQVLNVHLKPPIDDRTERFAFGAWWRAGRERYEEIQRFCAKLERGYPTLVAGDFNELSGGRAVRWLREQGYRCAVSPFDARTPTWRQRMGPFTLRRRMDHIFHCARLRSIGAAVIEAGASDHWPVMAEFDDDGGGDTR